MELKQFSFFQGGITSLYPVENITIAGLYEHVKSSKYQEAIQKLRNQQDEKKQSGLKSSLDYVTFSGVFEKRNQKNLLSYSNLICIDFDDVLNLQEKIELLSKDKYSHLVFISPSGKGIKVVVRVSGQADEHRNYWQSLVDYYQASYQMKADQSGKDIARACFLSYDPNAYFNQNASVFENSNSFKAIIKSSNSSDYERAKLIVDQLVLNGLDITEDYSDWMNLGFALATFGESGREFFHLLSQMNYKYNLNDCDVKFDECLKTGRFTNAAFLFKKAKQLNISIPRFRNFKNRNQVLEENGILTNGVVSYDLEDFKIKISSYKTEQTISDGFLIYIKYQTTDENKNHTWLLEIKKPDENLLYIEVSHDEFFEPKCLEKILGAYRLSISFNYVQLQKLRSFLFNSTTFFQAQKVLRYGLHPETELYFFANCAITKSGDKLYPDEFGIINFEDKHFSLPQINKGQKSPYTYIDNKVGFNEWYRLFQEAQGENVTFLATSFMLFSIFRDIGVKENNFSPMLYVTGIAGTAKSTLFVHLNYIFGSDGQSMGINLKGRNTEPAFVAKIEQRHNGFQFGDEYKPDHPLTPLFQATYDNKAYSKMNMNSTSYLDTTDLVPKCTIGFASNFLPQLPHDEPFFSRLILLTNNNRNRSDAQKNAFKSLLHLQENGITNVLREIWQHRDLIKVEFKTTYQLLKTSLEKYHLKNEIGNPRYIFNLAQVLAVPFILSKHGKISICEYTDEMDILNEFLEKSETSILASDRIVQEKSSLQEFFACLQELHDKGQVLESIHYRFDGDHICFNLQRLYKKFTDDFKRQNRFELTPPSLQTLQDEILLLIGITTINEKSREDFFRKIRFQMEGEPNKTDFARNACRINYQLLQKHFCIDF